MSKCVCRKEGAGKGGLEGKEREEGGRMGGAEGRRGAVVVWGGRGTGGRWREGKQAAKETKQIIQKKNRQCWTI